MTEHIKQRHGKINSYGDLHRRVEFLGDFSKLKTGMEMEFHIQDLRKPADQPSLASDDRVLELKDNLRGKGFDVDDEIAAHMIELKTDSYGIKELPDLVARVKAMRKTLVEEAAALDLKPSPFATLADLDTKTALGNLITPTAADPDRGIRPRTMMNTLQSLDMSRLIHYPLLNTSIQTSTGMKDADHMFESARRHYYLLPFYFTALNTRPPEFNKLSGEKKDIHSGIELRRIMGERGLVPASFYKATDGNSFMGQYYREVYDRPMLCHIDIQDEFHMATAYNAESIRTLKGKGLNTYSNFSLSESFDWFSGKRKAIPGTDFTRFEYRDIDSGLANDVTFTVLSALMTQDPDCGRDVDVLLESYGYGSIPARCAVDLENDLDMVHRNARAYLDIPYGTGRMDQFAKDFYATIESYARKYGVHHHLMAFSMICETGFTEAKMIDHLCDTKADVVKLQRTMSEDQLANGISIGMAYDNLGM